MKPLDTEGTLVAREMIQRLVTLARDMNDEPKLAMALHTQGHSFVLSDELEAAEKCFDESREISLRLGDKRSAALGLVMLGFVAVSGGRVEEGLPKVVQGFGDLEADDQARALVLVRLGEAAKKSDKKRFEAALKAASRSLGAEVQAEILKALG
ncbi:MAG TPA: hypothetical protein VFF73_25055 [Planctomycetota bacterium]|nr:hypothetical protein [Planctomycetota bacterium]